MRPILLGPFGSMGSMNMKMRNICVEDLTLETILLLIAVVRVWTADTFYEEIGGWGAVLSASTIACTLSMLVLDNGIQCMCCRKKPLCTWLCFGCINGSQIISDKSLMRLLLIVTQLGILSAVVTVITETCTFFDTAELRRHVVKMPKNYIGLHDYMEWHHAIAMIVVQVCVSIPWRCYVYQVTSGVLHAIHCVEVLKFRSAYSGDALRKLLPKKAAAFNVELANEGDISALAELYCESFQELFTHIGLPPDSGPSVIEAQWRATGTLTVRRWLGRVGVVKDESGHIVGALSLQLPGDTAAYASLSRESSSDTYNPLDVSTVSVSSFAGEGYMHHKRRTPGGDDVEAQIPGDCCVTFCTPHFSQLGFFNSLRFRYKHAIITDHVCTPGEAYVDFLCVKESAQREGVGSRLMQWAEVSAEQLGCGRIALSAWGPRERHFSFYRNLGYEQTDDRIDIVSYFIVQTTFCWKNRFYDYEKSLGVSTGLAIRSAKYGFTSDLVSDHDSSSGDLMASVHGLFSGVGSLSINRGFLMRRGGAVPSSAGERSEIDDADSSVRSSHGLLVGRGPNSSVAVVGGRVHVDRTVGSTIIDIESEEEVKTGDVAQGSSVIGDQKTPDTSGGPCGPVSNKRQLPVVPFGCARYSME